MKAYKKFPDGFYRLVDLSQPAPFYTNYQDFREFMLSGAVGNGDFLTFKENDGKILAGYIFNYKPHCETYSRVYSFMFKNKQGKWLRYFNTSGSMRDLVKIEKYDQDPEYKNGDWVDYDGHIWMVEIQIGDKLFLHRQIDKGVTSDHFHVDDLPVTAVKRCLSTVYHHKFQGSFKATHTYKNKQVQVYDDGVDEFIAWRHDGTKVEFHLTPPRQLRRNDPELQKFKPIVVKEAIAI